MKKNKAKTKKIAHIEEIRIQLCGTMEARHKHVMDKGDNEDDEVYMYLVDMHPDERDAYREAVRASKVTK